MASFLDNLLNESNLTLTENGAVTHKSTLSCCVDLFASIGSLRYQDPTDAVMLFERAYIENKDIAMKILFFARDIRGGMGERDTFRAILRFLAFNYSESVVKNIEYVPEFGRYDDLLCLLSTPIECEVLSFIKGQFERDLDALKQNKPVSLLGKWLPSINTSDDYTRRDARVIAKALGLTWGEYRKSLSALRKSINILENKLRTMDYSFDYSTLPALASFKHRQAFIRNDNERYTAYLKEVENGTKKMNTATVEPYQVVGDIADNYWNMRELAKIQKEERIALNTTWNNLPDYTCGRNALVVVDGSGSMYNQVRGTKPIDVALSLGIYFAERNKGQFKDHFITFSESPRLVKIKGDDIVDKVAYCRTFNEIANTNIEKVFKLILYTAIKYNTPQSELPETIYIISDMQFDRCTTNSNETNFTNAEKLFNEHGYKLPTLVFWNVNASKNNVPVTANTQGAVLVSGFSPRLFSMVVSGEIDPYKFMINAINTERYDIIMA